MFRPKLAMSRTLALLSVAGGMLASACSSPPEENVLRQYFRASGLRDNASLASFATVEFNPQTDGSVISVKVVSVSPERSEPLQVVALAKTFADMEGAHKALLDRRKAYQGANIDAIGRMMKAEAAGGKIAAKDAAIQAELAKWRDDTMASEKKVSDARTALARARSVPVLSLTTPNSSPEVSELDGNLISKDVTADATVKAPDGSTSQKQLVVTLSRAVVKGANGERAGTWIVTAVKPG